MTTIPKSRTKLKPPEPKGVLQKLVAAGLTRDQIIGLGKFKRANEREIGVKKSQQQTMRKAAGRKLEKYKTDTSEKRDRLATAVGDTFSPNNPRSVTRKLVHNPSKDPPKTRRQAPKDPVQEIIESSRTHNEKVAALKKMGFTEVNAKRIASGR